MLMLLAHTRGVQTSVLMNILYDSNGVGSYLPNVKLGKRLTVSKQVFILNAGQTNFVILK